MNTKLMPLILMIALTNIPLIQADQMTITSPVSEKPQLQHLPSTSTQPQAPAQEQQTPPAPQTAPDPALVQAVDASEQAANAWLKLLDQGSYGNSWDAGALALRLTMSRKEWVQTLDATRKPLGRPTDRKVADIRLSQDPKGLARGNYMIFLFETKFSTGHLAKEILTLQQNNKGEWHVLTYLVSVVK